MKSDTGKKDFEIYMNPHSDWGILFYSDLSNTSFSKQPFIKNINNITKKENENIDFSKTLKMTCYPINSSALSLVVTFVSQGNEKIELIDHL